jgi:hypothetical protein
MYLRDACTEAPNRNLSIGTRPSICMMDCGALDLSVVIVVDNGSAAGDE